MIEAITDQLVQKQAYLEENPNCAKTQEEIEVLEAALSKLKRIEVRHK